MPILVNGQAVPEGLIQQEADRLGRDPRWAQITDARDRARALREAAEQSAIDWMLLDYAAATDPRTVDAALLDVEVQRQKTDAGCREGFDDTLLRQQTERQFKKQRLVDEMKAKATGPKADEVEAFFQANRENFRNPELFQAAHVVVHVNETRTAEQARELIERAMAELDAGAEFAAVAERFSDCKGNGGELGQFPSGYMVDEFENALTAIAPGERTGIFKTPFGFHIARLHARSAGGAAPFTEVRSDIERVLRAMSEHEEYVEAMAVLRQRAIIVRQDEGSGAPA